MLQKISNLSRIILNQPMLEEKLNSPLCIHGKFGARSINNIRLISTTLGCGKEAILWLGGQ